MSKHHLLNIVVRVLLAFFLAAPLSLSGEAPVANAQSGTIFRVMVGGLSSGSCGSDWGSNACDLQNALALASAGAEIWAAAGTYTPSLRSDPASARTATFKLKDGVALYGGFAGTESSRGERDWASNTTILSGDIGAAGDSSDNCYHVVNSSGLTGSAVLDGFTITGGRADGAAGDLMYGGGMVNKGGSPTLSNVTFTNNSAASGGGMYNQYSSSPALSNVTFTANTATDYGGGMHNGVSSSPTLTNVTFTGNSAADGGGMNNTSASSPALTNVTFTDNNAESSGGGMNNYSGSNPTLSNVTFTGNSAASGGGMINVKDSRPALTNVTFTGNSATTSGGAIINEKFSSPSLGNVTFTGNSAQYGGGMYNDDSSSPTLTNVTFTANTATTSGGAMFNIESSPVVRNSILWGNTAPNGAQAHNIDSVPAYTRTIIQGDTSGGQVLNVDPLLAPLGSYGGATQTLALLPGSAAIDAASSHCPLTDQRGVVRSSPNCDLGAFESQGFQFEILGGDHQSTVIHTAFAQALVVKVTPNSAGEPVDGGKVSFIPPASNGSAVLGVNPVAITAGTAQVTATANGLAGGPYPVTVDAAGATSQSFHLTNTNTKGNQTIAFEPLTGKIYGEADFALNATASSGLAVTFAAAGNCSMADANTVHITGAGSCTITASQAGDVNTNAAPDVARSFAIGKATATLALSGLSQTYDGTPKAVTVTTLPEGLSGVRVTYAGSTTAPTNPGFYAVVASLTNDNYHAADAAGIFAIDCRTYLPFVMGR